MKKKTLALFLTAALLIAALAGCGNSSNDTNTQRTNDDSAVQTNDQTNTPQTAATQTDETGEAKVLKWFASGEITTMDSGKEYDVLSAEQIGYFNDTLYVFNSDNTAVPSIALGEPKLSDDGLTATIELRQDARFSNGDPITANEFVYAFRRAVDPATGSQAASNFNYVKNASEVNSGELPVEELGIKALSDYELEIDLAAPYPYLTVELADVVTAPVSQAFAEAQGDNYALSADALLSSGPFILRDWEGASISWRYEKNPYYWDADNIYFDEIDIQIIKDDQTGISLFEAGELDGTTISGEYITLYAGQPEYLTVPTLRMTNLEMGISSNEYLQNENLRQALAYSINREELTTSVLNGAGVPSIGIVPDGIAVNPSTGASVQEDFGALWSYDPATAADYWAKARQELGVDSVTLELLTSDDDQSIRVGTYLQNAIQTALPGVNVDVQNVTASVRFERMMSYDFDLALGGWSGDYNPTSYVKQHETSYEHNHSQWVSEELTTLVNQLTYEDGTDFDLRWQHLKEANQYLVDNVVTIGLYQGAKTFLANPQLQGVITHPLGTPVDVTHSYF